MLNIESIKRIFEPSKKLQHLEQQIPNETLLHIFGYLEPADLCSVSRVCSAWYHVADDSHLWRRYLPAAAEGIDAKKLYIAIMRGEMKRYRQDKTLPWLQERSHFDSYPRPCESPKKAIVLGSCGIGKTNFIRICMSQPFQRQYKATIGADFDLCKTKRGVIQLWQMAGPERFHNMAIIFYRNTDIFLLMFDLSQPKSIDGMLHHFKECKDMPREKKEAEDKYIVVGCKADLVPGIDDDKEQKALWEDVQRRSLEVGPVHGFFRVSAKTGDNIGAVIETMDDLLFPGNMGYAGDIFVPDLATWKRMAPTASQKNNNCCIQ